jgi:hypothetical protein
MADDDNKKKRAQVQRRGERVPAESKLPLVFRMYPQLLDDRNQRIEDLIHKLTKDVDFASGRRYGVDLLQTLEDPTQPPPAGPGPLMFTVNPFTGERVPTGVDPTLEHSDIPSLHISDVKVKRRK